MAENEIFLADPKSNPLISLDNHIIKKREDVRTLIAKYVVFGYLAIAAIIILIGLFADSPDHAKDMATAIFAPLTGIVGSVIGFYFSETRRTQSRESPED